MQVGPPWLFTEPYRSGEIFPARRVADDYLAELHLWIAQRFGLRIERGETDVTGRHPLDPFPVRECRLKRSVRKAMTSC
jgi:hypothetical protein